MLQTSAQSMQERSVFLLRATVFVYEFALCLSTELKMYRIKFMTFSIHKCLIIHRGRRGAREGGFSITTEHRCNAYSCHFIVSPASPHLRSQRRARNHQRPIRNVVHKTVDLIILAKLSQAKAETEFFCFDLWHHVRLFRNSMHKEDISLNTSKFYFAQQSDMFRPRLDHSQFTNTFKNILK
jgi:hypothetical protein